MFRLDFLGAPGVGKSLLSKRAQRCDAGALGPDCAAVRSIMDGGVKIKERGLRNEVLLRVPFLRQRFLGREIASLEKKAFPGYVKKHEGFFDFVHGCSWLKSNTFLFSYGYQHFSSVVRRIAFLEERGCHTPVLFDESLCQKSFAVIPWDSANEEHIRSYFEMVPLPDAMIHVDADGCQVVRQIYERKRTTGRVLNVHAGLCESQLLNLTQVCLQFARVGAFCIRERGCPVLSLAASDSPEYNRSQIVEFQKGLFC